LVIFCDVDCHTSATIIIYNPIMNKKELKKEYEKIRGKQNMEQDEAKDLYPIEDDVLAIALDYIPAKHLKRIIARYK